MAILPSYEALAAENRALREEVGALKALVEQALAENARLRGEGPPPASAAPRPAWVKPNVPAPAAARSPRAPRAPVPGRRLDEPDRQVVHAPDRCARCGTHLDGGRVVQRRQVIALPVVRYEVTEHVVLERTCRWCGRVGRGTLPDLGAEAGPHRRVGWDVAAWVAMVRTKLRLPIAQVQWLLEAVWGLHLARGEVCALLAEAAQAGEATYEQLLAEARASPAAHVDETGWRENGRNGYVWTVSTPEVRLFHFIDSRAGQVVRDLLGPDWRGVTISDFYRAYDRLEGPHQRCWAHFLRDIHKLTEAYPRHAELAVWAEAVQVLFRLGVAWTAQVGERPAVERAARARTLEGLLLAVCRAQEPETPQATLCQRVEWYHGEFFTFVAEPGVDPTNNGAERALRPLVIARKISGGTRSPQGSRTRMVLQSLMATWEVRGQDLFAAMRDLLRSPRPPRPSVVQV